MKGFLGLSTKLFLNRSMVAQISYATAGVTLVLSLVLSFYAASLSRQQIEHELGADFARRARNIVDVLDRGMFERYREIQIVSTLDDIRNPGVPVEKKRTILERMQQTFSSYAWIGICDAQGTGKVGTGKYLEGKDLSKRPWCVEGRDKPFVGDVHDALLLSKLLPNPSGEMFYLVDVASPIRDEGGGLQGVLCGHIFWGWAEELLDSKKSPGIDILILSRDGMVLAGPEKLRSSLGDMAPEAWRFISENVQSGNNDYMVDIWHNGRQYLHGHAHDAGYHDYPGLGWVVLIRQDAGIAFAPARALQLRIMLAGVALGLLFTMIGAFLARQIARPISRIAEAADKVAAGELEYDAPHVDGEGELAQLSNSVRTMANNLMQEIHDRKKAEASIEKLAHFDQLTDLPNRIMLQDRFKYAISLAQRGGEQLVLMFLDLDHFKNINDTLGHTIGDRLLMEVAKRLKAALRDEDTVSRLGGDEFILILPGTNEDGAAHVASKLLEEVAQHCLIEQHELSITTSIGIAIYPDDGENFESLSKNADAAMYRVKQSGRNGFRFYTPEMQAHSARTLQLRNALRDSLSRNELQLHYQPQVSIRNGQVVGAEALLRWQHPELGMISPAEFIPIAEDSGLIIPIGEWVIRTAASQLKAWMDDGLPAMVMAVNLSSAQFRQANIAEMVTKILDEARLPPEYLELELTEAVAMTDPTAAVDVMDRLNEQGIQMAIDDFGTGYSSLSYLKKFKVYKLKIDQSFVRDITDDIEDRAIVSAIINMAHSLGIRTIAEGVETAGQLAYLSLQGCEEAQGYYFSRPLSAAQFEAFVKSHEGRVDLA